MRYIYESSVLVERIGDASVVFLALGGVFSVRGLCFCEPWQIRLGSLLSQLRLNRDLSKDPGGNRMRFLRECCHFSSGISKLILPAKVAVGPGASTAFRHKSKSVKN